MIETEKNRYNEAWATGHYLPVVGLFYMRGLYREDYFRGIKTLLDVGCGTGVAVGYHRQHGGIEAYGIDFAQPAVGAWKRCGVEKYCSIASAEAIPFPDDSFDMVTCTDVLEHVPEENVETVLREMFRVGKRFFFTIALDEAKEKMPHDGSEPHVCIKPPEWWVEAAGMIGYRFWRDPYVTNVLVINARKPQRESILTLPATAIRRVHFARSGNGTSETSFH